jgi:hypothetical protein
MDRDEIANNVESQFQARYHRLKRFLEENDELIGLLGLRRCRYNNLTRTPPFAYEWIPGTQHNCDFSHILVSPNKMIGGEVEVFVLYQNSILITSNTLNRHDAFLMNELIEKFTQLRA